MTLIASNYAKHMNEYIFYSTLSYPVYVLAMDMLSYVVVPFLAVAVAVVLE